MRDKRTATVGAVRGRRIHPQRTLSAPSDHQLPVAAAGPERTIVLIEFGQHPARERGWGVIGHDKESTFQSAVITKIDG
jgi:hypothetical protein